MKRILNNSKLGLAALLMILAVAGTACKKKKNVQETPEPTGEVIVNEYCTGPEYFTSKDHFRASATGESSDREGAKKKARSNAEQELARSINSTIQVVTDNYINSTEFNNKEEVTETFQQLGRTVVDQKLSGAVKICEKLTQKAADGRYVSYVAIELSGEELLQEYNETLSKDERIQAEYNYQQFKDVFEQEMEKLSNDR